MVFARLLIRSSREQLIPRTVLGNSTTISSLANRYQSTSTSTSSISNRLCPSCSKPIPIPSSPCPSCNELIRIPNGLSHHSLLNLSSPISITSSDNTKSQTFDIPLELTHLPSHGFNLDAKELRQRMLQRQKDLHPDKFSSKGDQIVDLARELSGRVNEAYAILVDPLRRAEYLLSVHNLEHSESDSLTDPTLLAEILEAREELESAESQEEVDQLRAENHAKVETAITQIQDAFFQDPPNLAGAKILSIQLKYWMGLEAAAKEWSPKISL